MRQRALGSPVSSDPPVPPLGSAVLWAAAVAALACAGPVQAGETATDANFPDPNAPPAAPADGALGHADEELLLFQDVPVVVTASRQSQSVDWLSVPVSVVTAEDIHYGGTTTIPEALQFVPGMDVQQIDRNRWAVGMRGLHDTFSDRTLAMVDGHPAESIAFGGPEFLRFPMMVEDIERIEVVRGPGGAAWGANAFHGVINIITKDPRDVAGTLATTTVNQYGDTSTHLRHAGTWGKWSALGSVGYQDRRSSDDALADDDFDSRDFSRDWRFFAKAVYRDSEQTKLTQTLGYSHREFGDFAFAYHHPREDSRQDTLHYAGELTSRWAADKEAAVRWSGRWEDSWLPSVGRYVNAEGDLDVQFDFDLPDEHTFSAGGNARVQYGNGKLRMPEDLRYVDEPYCNTWLGLFVMDRWQATDRLVLEGQGRIDWYSAGELDWAGRMAAMLALDEEKRHVLRVSGAKAFRSPMPAQIGTRAFRLPTPGLPAYPADSAFVTIRDNDDVANEQIYAAEFGYRGQLTDLLAVRVDGFYHVYRDMLGHVTTLVPPLLPGPGLPDRRVVRPETKGSAEAFGGEVEARLAGEWWSLSAWYSYHQFRARHSFRAFLPADHKAGLTGRVALPDGWTLNANLKQTSSARTRDPKWPAAPSFLQLDLAVSKKLLDDRCELTLGVRDLLDRTDRAMEDTVSTANGGHPTPGRMLFVRLSWKF